MHTTRYILKLDAFNLDRVLEKEPDFLESDGTDHVHDDTVSSCSAQFNGELNTFKLNKWIGELISDPDKANDLFRYKGVLAVKGKEEK